jgi:hypothetical protein
LRPVTADTQKAWRTMRFDDFSFGSIQIDAVTYEYDIVIERGKVSKRKKKHSKKYRNIYGHTPLSVEEDIPWKCKCLVIGTGMNGAMPVMDEVKQEAKRRKIELVILPTSKAIEKLGSGRENTNAILHITC